MNLRIKNSSSESGDFDFKDSGPGTDNSSEHSFGDMSLQLS